MRIFIPNTEPKKGKTFLVWFGVTNNKRCNYLYKMTNTWCTYQEINKRKNRIIKWKKNLKITTSLIFQWPTINSWGLIMDVWAYFHVLTRYIIIYQSYIRSFFFFSLLKNYLTYYISPNRTICVQAWWALFPLQCLDLDPFSCIGNPIVS